MHERAGRGLFGRLLKKEEKLLDEEALIFTENIKLDYSYPETIENPHDLILDTAKLGILADRGVLFMEVGGSVFEVTNNSAARRSYGSDIHMEKMRIELTSDVVEFILSESNFEKIENEAELLASWFSNAAHLIRTATESNAYVLKTDGEDFSLNSSGIRQAWNRSGMPPMECMPISFKKVQIHMPYPEA